jgi:hypothetical protein
MKKQNLQNWLKRFHVMQFRRNLHYNENHELTNDDLFCAQELFKAGLTPDKAAYLVNNGLVKRHDVGIRYYAGRKRGLVTLV